MLVDIEAIRLARRPPLLSWRGQAMTRRHPQRAIQCHPAHHPGVEKFLAAAPHFPYSLIGAAPVSRHPVGQLDDPAPQRPARPLSLFIPLMQRVQQLAIDVELKLVICRISDPYGPRASVALEMIERPLDDLPSALDRIDALQLAGRLRLRAPLHYPLCERTCLPAQSDAAERVDRER